MDLRLAKGKELFLLKVFDEYYNVQYEVYDLYWSNLLIW